MTSARRAAVLAILLPIAAPRASAQADTARARADSSRRTVMLPAVRVEAKLPQGRDFETKLNLGTVLISRKELGAAPIGVLGEADLLRAAQLLPGVEAHNDYSAGVNVRGGEADQN